MYMKIQANLIFLFYRKKLHHKIKYSMMDMGLLSKQLKKAQQYQYMHIKNFW